MANEPTTGGPNAAIMFTELTDQQRETLGIPLDEINTLEDRKQQYQVVMRCLVEIMLRKKWIAANPALEDQ